ncbi:MULTISPECIES: hypothetical protein [unclassified Curtobacterium]|uniref:zinc-ribbon domain-containing protein n=1 Tax=unclassified Curtobacterium TaxID=257496 RepID=UPI0015E882E0|nr:MULTISPECIES: hypothetical protein [unclassified Curtobacterium]
MAGTDAPPQTSGRKRCRPPPASKSSSSYRFGRGGLVICDHGHQHSSQGRCPICSNGAVAPGYNDLATTHPNLAKELDPVLNGATTAQTIQAAARRKLAWRYPRNGHLYWATASNRTTTHPQLAAELDPADEAGHPATKMCADSGNKPE